MRILACADIHMGRKPAFAPSGHSSWDAIIEKAISLSVDAVVLVGDVVEQEQAWLSVYGPLLAGLKKLKDANIQVIGVGGNHDHNVFPRLSRDSDAIKLLGLGGTWEAFDIGCVRFLGWSFPDNHMKTNPLVSLNANLLEPSRLTLGLLHTDYGMAVSAYAPTQEQDFFRSNVELWMLGHIHKKGKVGNSEAYYCGSPYALDVHEMGQHGVYLIETEADLHFKTPVFVPLCPYRYETCPIDVTGIVDLDGLKSQLTGSIRSFAQNLHFEGSLYIKALFTGSLAPHLHLSEVMTIAYDEAVFLFEEQGAATYLLGRYEDQTDLKIDMQQLSEGSGADALLAKKLLDPEELMRYAKQYQNLHTQSFNSSAFSSLESIPLDLEAALLLAKQAGMQLLKAMVAQKEGEQ